MKTLITWWASKPDNRRQNWLLLSLFALFLASGFVEALPYIAALCMIPVALIIYIEIKRPA
jgi:hypothetical protein